MACPLRSTDITPLPRYYQAVRPSASHPSGFSANIDAQVLMLRPPPLGSGHLYAGCRSVRKQVPPELSPTIF